MSYGQAQMASNQYEESAKVPYTLKKTKKPGFIKRWLLSSLRSAIEAERETNHHDSVCTSLRAPMAISKGSSESLDSQPMHMKIYRANGGTIIETTVVDRQKDRHQHQLHIIGHDTDLGQGLAKIITLESLRG